jgi:flavin reductase (DIM6/NTAB) family NADH-FMN oxidoreductase RutF/rubredoxin
MNYESFFDLSYGMYIVSTGNREMKKAYIANTVFQVSSEPPKLAISAHKENSSTELLLSTGAFTVSVLKKDTNPALIRDLGYKQGNPDKFSNLAHFYTDQSLPVVVEDTVAWFECKVSAKLDVGTHWLIIGDVQQAEQLLPNEDVLTYEYYRNFLKGYSPSNAPTYVNPDHLHQEDDQEATYEQNPQRFKCLMCSYVYDPKTGDLTGGIEPGTSFEDLPDDWICPVCGVGKDMFDEL